MNRKVLAMRKILIAVAVPLAVFLATSCSGESQQRTPDPTRSVSLPSLQQPSQEPPESVEPASPDDPIDSRGVITPREQERADDIVTIVCGIVTHDVNTYEFPDLWEPGSRETVLAAEYEKLINSSFDQELERECPAYARLHSKNDG